MIPAAAISKNYIPALNLDWLTPFYDIIIQSIIRESTIKPRLVEQMGIGKGHRVLDLGCGHAYYSHQKSLKQK